MTASIAAAPKPRSADRVIDLHCHVLPGIDDGPATVEDALALARAASATGVTKIVATPHVSRRYANEAETIARLVAELNERLVAQEVALEVIAGAEIALTSAVEMPDERLAELALGDGRWLLIEPPFTPAASGVDSLVMELIGRGQRVVLAHPERCPGFHRDPAMLKSLVRAGALTSITAGSLVGRFGVPARRLSLELVHDGLVHNVASDAHDHVDRAPGLSEELARAGLRALEPWLTMQVPAAILAGNRIPPPPSTLDRRIEGRRRRRLLRRR